MDTKEKIKQSLDTLSEKDLEKVDQLIEGLKGQRGHRTRYLKTYDLGGKYDHINLRDIAYE